MVNKIYPNLVFKPKNINEYKKLLLLNSNSSRFKLSSSDIINAKEMMYIREKALKFEKQIGGFHVFRGDSNNKIISDFKNTKKNLSKNLHFLELNGVKLNKENETTLSKEFL
jgi:hypothetical protein